MIETKTCAQCGKSHPREFFTCPQCGNTTWHAMIRYALPFISVGLLAETAAIILAVSYGSEAFYSMPIWLGIISGAFGGMVSIVIPASRVFTALASKSRFYGEGLCPACGQRVDSPPDQDLADAFRRAQADDFRRALWGVVSPSQLEQLFG